MRNQETFCFSMTDFAQSVLLPDLMAQLHTAAPAMTVNSYYLSRREQRRAMAAGQLDLAIDTPVQQDAELRHKPLLADGYVCVLGDKHPARNQPLTLDTYLQLQHLHISSRQQGVGHVDAALHKLGLSRQVRLRVASYLVVPHLLARSELVSTVPVTLARQLNLASLPLPFAVPPLELHVYWHKNAERDPASQWIREVLENLSVLGAGESSRFF